MADTVEAGDILFRLRGDASQLESEINRAQGALGNLEGSADDTSGSLDSMGNAAGQVNTAMKGLSRGGISGVAAGLNVINPAAGRLVRTLGYLRYATAPLAVAMVAAGAAVKLYTDEQERQNRVAEQNASISEALAASNSRLQTTLEDLAVATGDLTAEELQLLRARRQVFTESLPAMQEATQAILEEENRVRQLTARIAELEERQGSGAAMAGEFAGSITASASATIRLDAELRKARSSLEESTGIIETQTAARDQMLQNIERQIEAQRQLIDAEVRAAAATKAQARADKEAEAAARSRAAANQVLLDTLKGNLAEAGAESSAALEQVIGDLDAAFSELERQTIAGQQAMAQGITDSLAAVSTVSGLMADKMADDNEKAAKRAFRVSQAAAVAQIGINTASAIVRQYADLPAPAALVSSIGIGALGAAQAAVVLAQPPPVAHIGTGMPGSRDPLAPDERISSGRRVLTTEASGPAGVANSMGTQLLNDVNTGRVQSSGRITAVIGRSHLDQELFRSGRRGTSRYARSLRTNPHPKPQGGY